MSVFHFPFPSFFSPAFFCIHFPSCLIQLISPWKKKEEKKETRAESWLCFFEQIQWKTAPTWTQSSAEFPLINLCQPRFSCSIVKRREKKNGTFFYYFTITQSIDNVTLNWMKDRQHWRLWVSKFCSASCSIFYLRARILKKMLLQKSFQAAWGFFIKSDLVDQMLFKQCYTFLSLL